MQIRSIPANTASPYSFAGFSTSWGTAQAYGYSVAHTYGTLPDPYTSSATLLTTAISVSNPIPMVALRPI